VHDALASNGFGGAPLWDTEWGSPSSAFPNETARAEHFRRYFAEFEAQARAGLSLGPSFIHTFKDDNSGEATMGLFKADGVTAKEESWKVIQEQMAKPWPGITPSAAVTA
jgi:hypothetical protein